MLEDGKPVAMSSAARKPNALHDTAFFRPGPQRSLIFKGSTALAVAAFGFLAALAVGAVLLIGAKLQAPDLGAGASPLTIFNSIVVVSLGSLGAQVHVGDVSINAIPLGGLLVTGSAIAWAAHHYHGRFRSLEWSLFVGVLLGGILAVAAIVFQIGEGPDRAFVETHQAFGTGLVWGSLFSLVRWPSSSQDRNSRRLLLYVIRAAKGSAPEGPGAMRAGLNLALSLLTLSGAAAAFGAIVFSIKGASSVASGLGILIHAIAFLPNLAVSVAAVAMGASVEAGYGSLASAGADAFPSYSLLDWGSGAAPVWAWFLVAIPIVVLLRAGGRMREVCRGKDLGTTLLYGTGCTLVFVVALTAVAGAGDAQVGADLQTEGFLRLSVNGVELTWLALGWAVAGLAAGWALAAIRDRQRGTTPTPESR
ncbi:MAG TPA: hypothetical protein VEV82_10045 [Actinomycetota bacterium]|nr:hypothetical protein [Actinomycetota bacterium]